MRRRDIQELIAFAAIAEAGSFTRAAAQLQISPSAISQTVRALEGRLGIRLFNRTTRSVRLTEAGERLHGFIRPALEGLDGAVDSIAEFRSRPAGLVRVMAQRLPATLYLQPVLRRFTDRYPDIQLDITLEDDIEDPISAGYDAALRLGETVPKDLVAVRLGPDLRQLVVAAPDYLNRHGAPETPQDLRHHRCINWRRPGDDGVYSWEFFDGKRWFEIAVAGPLVFNDRSAAAEAAVAGVGIVQASEPLIRGRIATGELITLLDAWAGRFPGFHICVPQLPRTPPALRALLDFLRCEFPSS